jgi:hypothetical protein
LIEPVLKKNVCLEPGFIPRASSGGAALALKAINIAAITNAERQICLNEMNEVRFIGPFE